MRFQLVCKICNEVEVKSNLGLSIHLNYKHNDIKTIEYLKKYENFKIPKCVICEKEASLRGNRQGMTFNKTCDSEVCLKQLRMAFQHTEETKELIRRKRFEYLKKKTGKTAWERRAKGELSYLEKWFFDNVIEKYNLYDIYDIGNEYPVYPYFIDFAFLNIKLCVELDGACHFKNKKRIEHDIKRDNFLVDEGWKIYRIRFDEISDDTVDSFLEYLETYESQPKILGNTVYRGAINKKPKLTLEERIQKKKERSKQIKEKNYIEIWKSRIESLNNSNIDFSIAGWSKEVADVVGIRPQKVMNFMRTHCPKHLENAWIRKGTKAPTV